MFPKEIIQIISEYDYELMCTLHQSNFLLISANKCTYELAEYTAKHDYVHILEYILSYYNINLAEIENLFETAVMSYSTNIVQYIYTRYKNEFCTDFVHSYLLYSIENKYTDIVYFLINHHPDIEYNNGEILLTAISSNDTPLVQYILDHPQTEDPTYYNENPFIRAIELRHSSIIETMMNHPKIEVHEPDNEPFRVALDIADHITLGKLMNNAYIQQTLQLDLEERYRLHELVW